MYHMALRELYDKLYTDHIRSTGMKNADKYDDPNIFNKAKKQEYVAAYTQDQKYGVLKIDLLCKLTTVLDNDFIRPYVVQYLSDYVLYLKFVNDNTNDDLVTVVNNLTHSLDQNKDEAIGNKSPNMCLHECVKFIDPSDPSKFSLYYILTDLVRTVL
jgi:hypothetical protein